MYVLCIVCFCTILLFEEFNFSPVHISEFKFRGAAPCYARSLFAGGFTVLNFVEGLRICEFHEMCIPQKGPIQYSWCIQTKMGGGEYPPL